MAESNQISRKRMRFSSPSAGQILTKTKSLIQRDRFGRIVSHTGNESPSLIGKIESKIIRSYPRVTIKDLRLRRVFSSPSSISIDWEFKPKGENHLAKEQNVEYHRNSNIEKEGTEVNGGGLGNGGAEDFLQTTPPDSESTEPISAVNEAERINVQAVTKSGSNLCSKSVFRPCSRAKIFKNTGSFSYKRMLPYLMQAADDGTSLSRSSKSVGQDPSVIISSCDKETAEDPNEEVSEMMTTPKCQLPETTKPVLQSVDTAGSLCGNTSPLKKVIVSSSPNKKSACSRRKLFKTPGSVNYRRMLPYLSNIKEENPCMSETVDHPDLHKIIEENTPSSMIVVSENEGTQEMVTSNVARESDACFDKNKESVPCEAVSVSPERSDLDKEQETQVKHVIPDTEKNLEAPHNVLVSEVPLSPPPLVGSSEVAKSALDNTFIDNVVGEENMNGAERTEAKPCAEQQLEADSFNLGAELLDTSVELETPSSVSPSKGILKRSIRGCRGICSCLNCSSFRLNAERAFEFSRNQLQDTEVMVLDLVGEISHLRDMLEKYSSQDHNESSKNQAGEASKRAYEAAELAKSRLLQMNDDLQVHCRIPNEQRARVKFAHYVHEKTILKATEPNNLTLKQLGSSFLV